jgi:uncharacterized protein YdbL (DUF1318 family)
MSSNKAQDRIEGPLADGRVGSRIENYTGFWKKDANSETEGDNANRLHEYTDVVNGALPPQILVSICTDSRTGVRRLLRRRDGTI